MSMSFNRLLEVKVTPQKVEYEMMKNSFFTDRSTHLFYFFFALLFSMRENCMNGIYKECSKRIC